MSWLHEVFARVEEILPKTKPKKQTNRHPIKNKQTKQNKTVLSAQLVT